VQLRRAWRELLERVRHNWPLKLLSLVVAVVLWYFVLNAEDPQSTQTITVPVVPVNMAENLEAIGITPSSVELRLRGRQSALRQAEAGRIRMEANLRNAEVGENEVPLRVAGVPINVRVMPGYSTSAMVELDTVIERTRPVLYERLGTPADGFVIDQIAIEPNEVTVRGATTAVREVAWVGVVVDTSGLNATVSFDAEVEARNHRDVVVSGVSFSPSRVTVTVSVSQVNVRSVPVRPIIGQPPSGYAVTSVSTSPLVVTITGDGGLQQVESVATTEVDISGLRGTKTYPVPLNVPGTLSVIGPASVQVTVTTQPASGGGPAAPPRGEGEGGGGGGGEVGRGDGLEEESGGVVGNQESDSDADDGDDTGGTGGTGEDGGGETELPEDNAGSSSATTPGPVRGPGT
jgi:YbbR domain-containing protein